MQIVEAKFARLKQPSASTAAGPSMAPPQGSPSHTLVHQRRPSAPLAHTVPGNLAHLSAAFAAHPSAPSAVTRALTSQALPSPLPLAGRDPVPQPEEDSRQPPPRQHPQPALLPPDPAVVACSLAASPAPAAGLMTGVPEELTRMLASFTMAAGTHVKAGVAPGCAATAAAAPAAHADGQAAGVRHGDSPAQPTDVSIAPAAAPATAASDGPPTSAPARLQQEDAIGAALHPTPKLKERGGDIPVVAGGVTSASGAVISLDGFKAMLQQAAGTAALPPECAKTDAAAEAASSAKPSGSGDVQPQPPFDLGCKQLECWPVSSSDCVLNPAGAGGASGAAVEEAGSIAGAVCEHPASVSEGGASTPVLACAAAESQADSSYDGPLIFGSAAGAHGMSDASHRVAEGAAEGTPKLSTLTPSVADALADPEDRAGAPESDRGRGGVITMPVESMRRGTGASESTVVQPGPEPIHTTVTACATTQDSAVSDEGDGRADTALQIQVRGSDGAPQQRGAWRGTARAAGAVGECAASVSVGDSLDVLAAPLTTLAARAPTYRADGSQRNSTAEPQHPPGMTRAAPGKGAIPAICSAALVAPCFFGSQTVMGAAAACVRASPQRYPPSPAPSDDVVRCGSAEFPPDSVRACTGAGRSAPVGGSSGRGEPADDAGSPAPDSPASAQPLWGSPERPTCERECGFGDRGPPARAACPATPLGGSPVPFAPSPLPAELLDGGELYAASGPTSPQAASLDGRGLLRPSVDMRPGLSDMHPVLQDVAVGDVGGTQTQQTSHDADADTGVNL